MYRYEVYLQRGGEPTNDDQIFARLICSQRRVADFVSFMNEKHAKQGQKYYFIRVSEYITDTITNGGY